MTTPLKLTDDQLVQFLRSRAGEPPPGLLGEILDSASSASQVRGWMGLGTGPASLGGMQGRSLVILFAAAALLVVLLTGAVIVGSGLLPDPPPVLPRVPDGWSGPVRPQVGAMEVQPLDFDEGTGVWRSTDAMDASVDWVDMTGVALADDVQPHWYLDLVGAPSATVDGVPVRQGDRAGVTAHGLVFETTGDSVADYVVGIEDDPTRGADLRVFVTDLASGTTNEQIGPPYGFPVEFAYFESEADPQVVFTFLPGTSPPGLDASTARFYAWASTTDDGEVVAWDYAPDTAWLSLGSTEPTTQAAPANGSERVRGWPATGPLNPAGLYSWDGVTCHTTYCSMDATGGFMHSSGVEIWIVVDPEQPTTSGATAAAVAGNEGTYRESDVCLRALSNGTCTEPARREEWTVDIEETTIAIRLHVLTEASSTNVDEAHAIIDSMRTEAPWSTGLGWRLVFRIPSDNWDSG